MDFKIEPREEFIYSAIDLASDRRNTLHQAAIIVSDDLRVGGCVGCSVNCNVPNPKANVCHRKFETYLKESIKKYGKQSKRK